LAATRKRKPTKAFETTPGLEFEFFLAQELGMTVARMRVEMGGDEYTRWCVYWARKAQREELELAKVKRR
jgi:hypothetical protein